MAKETIKTASLDDLKKMRDRSELHHDPDAPEGEDLDAGFWATAEIFKPVEKKSVHLRVDSDVLAFFKHGGKGHLTRMNAVLRHYMEAQKSKRESAPHRP